MFAAVSGGFDRIRFSAIKQRLPEAAIQALTPAVREMVNGTKDLRKLEKVAADFLSVNLPQVDAERIRVQLAFRKDPQNGRVYGLTIYAEATYEPAWGVFSRAVPEQFDTVRPWVATFGNPEAGAVNPTRNP